MLFSRRMVATLIATLATAGGVVAPAAQAGAAPRGGTSAIGTVATDGERLVAWLPEPGAIRVVDERAGTLVEQPAPAGCGGSLDEIRLGGGQLALLCWDDARIRSRLFLLDLGSGSWRELPDPDGWRRRLGGGFELVDLGARWLEAATDMGGVLVDPRSGEPRQIEPPAGAATALDLDAEQAYGAVCASGLAHAPIAYDPPYLLGAAGRHRVGLWRCGAARPVPLGAYADTLQLGGDGIVSWEIGANAGARAYVARCGLVFAWPGFSFGGIAHTREALYTVGDGRLRRLPLPARCPRPTTLRVRPAANTGSWTRVTAQLWPTSGSDSDDDAPVAVRPPGAIATAPVVRQPPGGLELRLPHPATQVRWRIGKRRWNGTMQGTDRRRWRIPGPRRRGLTRIAIEAKDDRGVVAQRYLLTVRR